MKKTIQPPMHLSKEAKQYWKALIIEYGIDDVAGLRILRVALEAYDRAQMARAAIDKCGMLYKDRWGAPKSHPLLPIERDSRAAFLADMKALNLDVEPIKGIGRPPGR
jgi:phage terminase small subunit